MQLTHDHLKTLYDLLAMQQAELLTMQAVIRDQEGQLTQQRQRLKTHEDLQAVSNGTPPVEVYGKAGERG